MSAAVDTASNAPETPGRNVGMTHFAIAAAVLLAMTVGWNVALRNIHLAKKPIAPPAGTVVEDHRLTSFPRTLPGPETGLPAAYVLAGDGELTRDGETDGKPDGLVEPREEELGTMGILKSKLNWYYLSVYRDLRTDPKRPRYIRLDVTYYTGLLEAVPHVPERCIVANGGTILRGLSGAKPLNLRGLPDEWKEWNGAEMYRTAYEVEQNGMVAQSAQYHLFSANGHPTAHWEKVRWDVGALTLQYGYFAKIQVAPYAPEDSLEATDQVCRDFLRAALPSILRALPSAAEVEKLETAGR